MHPAIRIDAPGVRTVEFSTDGARHWDHEAATGQPRHIQYVILALSGAWRVGSRTHATVPRVQRRGLDGRDRKGVLMSLGHPQVLHEHPPIYADGVSHRPMLA